MLPGRRRNVTKRITPTKWKFQIPNPKSQFRRVALISWDLELGIWDLKPMRIFNRAHVPWAIFVFLATVFTCWLYVGNFRADLLPSGLQLPPALVQKPSDHRSIGGTPLGLIFGTIALSIFVFAALLGVRKKLVLWRVGTVQRWLRAHIWLTLLTIPLVILHSGFRFGGPMTTLLIVLYTIVMVSGIYGLALQHQIPRIMKERLPAETVYEQIPHIRAQLHVAAQKMRDSFKPASPKKTDAGAPAPSAGKAVTTGSAPMASTAADLSTPAARAKSVVGSTITAATVSATAATTTLPQAATTQPILSASTEKEPETMGTPTARVAPGVAVPAGSQAAVVDTPPPPAPSATPPAPVAPSSQPAVAPKPVASPAPKPATAPVAPSDAASEAAIAEFLERHILPYLAARRGYKLRLGNARFSDDTFRFVRLRITEAYRMRVDEIQAWCDERRMLDLQIKLHHWLHAWLFLHVPISFLLLMLTAWHAFVTLFYY
jgi:hypothetical protein